MYLLLRTLSLGTLSHIYMYRITRALRSFYEFELTQWYVNLFRNSVFIYVLVLKYRKYLLIRTKILLENFLNLINYLQYGL